MLPSLNALSLGAPTGARDDVVTEIRDERVEALHKAWEVAEEEREEEKALGPQLEALPRKGAGPARYLPVGKAGGDRPERGL